MSFDVNFKLTVNGWPAGISRTTKNTMIRSAFVAVAAWWHKVIRPTKFTREGAAKYHYERRTKAYRALKRRRFGHDNPLEFSGVSRTSTRIRDIRPSSKKVRVVMKARAFNLRPKGHKKKLSEEFLAVTKGDAKQIAKRFAVVIGRLIRGYSKSRTRSF